MQVLRSPVHHVERRGAPPRVVSCVPVAALSDARFLTLAHPRGQFTSDSFALARCAVLTRRSLRHCGRTRPTGAPRVKHLRRDGARVCPPRSIRTRLLLLPLLLRKASTELGVDDGVGGRRRALGWVLLTEARVLLVARIRWSRPGWCVLPPGRGCVRAPLAVRADARSTPVVGRIAARAPAHLRHAPCAERREGKEEKSGRNNLHDTTFSRKQDTLCGWWSFL